MRLFVSYSSRDDTEVKTLVRDLEATRHSVWVDEELAGGDSWWREILERIRQCDVFVLALSNNSLRSKPCRAELGYATALGLPIVPVQIGPVESPRLVPVARIQIVDYRSPSGAVGISLVNALQEGAAQRGELPDPLPEPPPIPYEYLMRLATRIDGPVLEAADQLSIVVQLRESLEVEDDDSVREDVVKLLRRLRTRADVTFRAAGEIDALLSKQHPAAQVSTPQVSTRQVDAPPLRTTASRQPPASAAPQPAASRPASAMANPSQQRGHQPPTPQPLPPRPAYPTVNTAQYRASQMPPQPMSAVRPDRAGPGRQLAIWGIVLGVAGLIPIFFGIVGIAGIVCAGFAKAQKHPLANAALAVSISCTVVGLVLVVVLYNIGS